MRRRSFIYGATSVCLAQLAHASIAEADSKTNYCEEKTDTEANFKIVADGGNPNDDMAKNYPIPQLATATNFVLTPNFVKPHKVLPPHYQNWEDHAPERKKIEWAIKLMNAVWSSEMFRDRVSRAGLLWWKYDKHPNSPGRQISGPDLYNVLIKNKTPVVDFGVIAGSASAASGGNETDFRVPYVTNASVYQICNTISHEYTHLEAGGESLDKGYQSQPDASLFVSYGIGGLTEEIAAGVKLYGCNLSPQT